MRIQRPSRPGRLGRAALVVALSLTGLVAGVAVSGVAASNAVPAVRVGHGIGPVQPYTASNISFTLANNAPRNITSVSFTLDTEASEVAVRPDGSTWYSCSSSGGNSWVCSTTNPQLTAAGVNGRALEIVATDR